MAALRLQVGSTGWVLHEGKDWLLGTMLSADVHIPEFVGIPVRLRRSGGSWYLILPGGNTSVVLDGVDQGRTALLALQGAGNHWRVQLRRQGVTVDLELNLVHESAKRPTAPCPTAPPRPAAATTSTAAPAPTSNATRTRRRQTVGRTGSGCDLELEGLDVALQHAELRHDNGRWVLLDRSKALGTYLNGEKVALAVLQSGDVVTIGHHQLTVDDQGAVRRNRLPKREDVLIVNGLTASYRKDIQGKRPPRLRNLDLRLNAGSVVAVIGPSGVGKSSLFLALLGKIRVLAGEAWLGDIPLAQMGGPPPHLVSLVPQQDVVHLELTVRYALLYAARLRLAQDAPEAELRRRVDVVIHELDLVDVAGQAIRSLSGGQRKRVSIGLELLSQPVLLLLDEPTSGLDEGLDRQIMHLLKELAEGGTLVLIVTHSTTNLDLADEVVAVGGNGLSYQGPARGLLAASSVNTVADLMDVLRRAPTDSRTPTSRQPSKPIAATRRAAEPRPRTIRVLLARQIRLLTIQRGTLLGALLAPALAGLLATTASELGVSGSATAINPSATLALTVLVVAASVLAGFLSAGQIVGDLALIERERRWGVAAGAQVTAKALAFGALAALQAAVMSAVYLSVKPGADAPLPGALGQTGLGPDVALVVILVTVAISSCWVGLLVSACATRAEQAILMAAGLAVLQLSLTGLLIPLGEEPGPALRVPQGIAYLVPSRWGVAAAWSAFDLPTVAGGPRDALWQYDATHVVFPLLALSALGLGALLLARLLLNRRLTVLN